MSAGTLWAKIVLDHPQRYHCGPDDTVTGHVRLTYSPPVGSKGVKRISDSQLQSLFGPLKVFLTFHGRAKTKIHKSNGNSSSTYRGRAPLFRKHYKIHDGPITVEAGKSVQLPFSLNFPAATQNLPGQGDFRQSNRFHEEAGGPLPPTFEASNAGFSRRWEAFVEYRINAEVRMPGIDVKIAGIDHEDHGPHVLYEQPRLPSSSPLYTKVQQYSHTVSLQNENLLPEDQRPVGFRQKAKFKFSSEEYPTYVFDVMSTVPKDIRIGQPLVFELSVHPNFNRCTAPLPPEIKLSSLRAYVESHVEIRSEYGFLSHEEGSRDKALPYLRTMILEQEVPFCKANDHTKVIQTQPISQDARSSFTTYNICQRYTMEIEFCIFAAGKEKRFKRRVPITVHPPIEDDGMPGRASDSGYAEASSSSAAAAASDPAAKDLPAPPTPPKPELDLPEYERPPEYDQVLDMRTENDEPAASNSGKGKAAAT